MKERKCRPSAAAPAFYRRFIAGLPAGQVFTTRDLLPFARRSTLDPALSRMVKNGYLERIVRGVFRVKSAENAPLTAEFVASIKRRSFAGETGSVGTCISGHRLKRMQDSSKKEKTRRSSFVFVSDGRTSSFNFFHDEKAKRINLKAVAMRMLSLGETCAGRSMRDLWLLGNKCRNADIHQVWSQLTKKDIYDLPQLRQLLPQWLSELLPELPSWALEAHLRQRLEAV